MIAVSGVTATPPNPSWNSWAGRGRCLRTVTADQRCLCCTWRDIEAPRPGPWSLQPESS